MAGLADDRIHPVTRVVAAAIIPFLLLAFAILYFMPEQSGSRFAYRIWPPVMAAYVGAGYLGGAWFFARVLFGRRWHRVAAGFPAVTAFTWSMLAVTVLHWNRYGADQLGFQLWVVLYTVTPVLVPALWLFNRRADPGKPEAADIAVPLWFRRAVRALGLVMAAVVLVGFFAPSALAAVWPWPLGDLTARLLAGWGALLAVSNLWISFEPRWSAWAVGVESIALWHLLFLISAVLNAEDFTAGLVNWYIVSIGLVLALMIAAYARLEGRRRAEAALQA